MPIAVITGASRGLGLAIAEALAPTHSLLLAGRPSAPLAATAQRFGADIWPVDLAEPESIARPPELSAVDVLVHNAGVAYPGRVGQSTVEQWQHTLAVNVTGVVALTLALLPALRAAGGQVVLINSGAGRTVSPGLAAYSASKFALRAFADSLRADEPSVRVTSVHPGRIDTDMQQDLVAYEGGTYRAERYLAPATVAQVVANVVATPADADVHEVVIRPR